MLLFPNAKINLGLHITAKRADGYHEIESCLLPVPWCDVLEWVETDRIASLTITGADFGGNFKENLVFKAYKLLQKDFQLPNLEIHLHKLIPSGAGLGGGSADAAFMLKSLNQQFDLFLDDELLEDYAAQLGSDCPFFIKNVPQLATGRGEVLKPIEVRLSGWHLTIVKPKVSVPTAQAYKGVTPKLPEASLKEILALPPTEWKNRLKNDFEESVFRVFPEVAKLKDNLYQVGATYASMSGSGAAVFALSQQPLSEIDLNKQYIVWQGNL
jgi:4-diphosphocytidyl-2-C-methyl-D-erythritol kinase